MEDHNPTDGDRTEDIAEPSSEENKSTMTREEDALQKMDVERGAIPSNMAGKGKNIDAVLFNGSSADSQVTVLTKPSVMGLNTAPGAGQNGGQLPEGAAKYALQYSSAVAHESAEEVGDRDWIDKTNQPLQEIGKGYVLPPHLVTLCLTNNRLKEINNLDHCRVLQELILRQNSITEIKGLDTLEKLVELDLYMNHVEAIPPTAFQANPLLKKLDLGFNRVRSLESFPSTNLQNVEEIFLLGNKINSITGLHGMPKLVMLELGDNRIRKIRNLDSLPSLLGLWLGRNKLTKIENLDSLLNLRRLGLQSNRIEAIEGLGHLSSLEELYLSHNGIKSMKGLEKLSNLRVLDLATNFIEHIEGIQELPHLKEFWINDNKLASFDELKMLQSATQLETVYLEGNPLAKDKDYEKKTLEILPDSLEQLDALLVDDVRKNMATREQEGGQGEHPNEGPSVEVENVNDTSKSSVGD